MLKRVLNFIVLFFLSVVVANCDTLKPTIRGTIVSTISVGVEHAADISARISGAAVTIACPGITRRSQKVISDADGAYVLDVVGYVEDCELIIKHPNFKEKIIRINKSHLKDERYGLAPVYEIDVKLEPKDR